MKCPETGKKCNRNCLPSVCMYEHGKVVSIEQIQPHKVSEVICVHCGKRWICVRPEKCLLAWIECPDCYNQGYVIETGETIIDE